ncbi:hypothetical protein Aperf_G00000068330 [Anoplocephala perfoliata]
MLPNPKSFPQLQLPESSPPSRTDYGNMNMRASRLSIAPRGSVQSTPMIQLAHSQDGSATPPPGKGYFSRLNIAEVVARRPSPKREIQIERSVSPFLKTSPSNIDIRSLGPKPPPRNRNQLYVPGQEGFLGGSSPDLHRIISNASVEIPRTPTRRASPSPPNVIPPSPRVQPPRIPSPTPRPQLPKLRKNRAQSSSQGRMKKFGEDHLSSSAHTSSRSSSYRLTAPPRRPLPTSDRTIR